jgi:peptide/nickel transport system substrate-binding protein
MTTSFGGGALAIPKSYYDEVGYEGFQQEPISTGPWQVEEWDQGTRLTLSAHEDYHITDEDGNQYPYLDTVQYDSIPETSTLIGALENGEIHMSSAIEAGSVPQVEAANGVSVSRKQALDWWAIAFNTTREPFDTPRRRRGFAKLLDRRQFVERAQFDEASPAVGPIPPQVPDFGRPNEEKNQAQAFAPEEGLEILESEGVDDASFKLLSSPRYDRWMRNVRSQFQERAPDLTVEIRQIQQSEYWTVKGRPNLDYDISLSFTTQMFDPDGIYTFYRQPDQGGVINETGFSPETADNAARVNELLGEQRRETDHEKRVELFHEIEDLVIQDTPDAYMMHTNDLLPIRDEVTGWNHPPNLRPTKGITIDE